MSTRTFINISAIVAFLTPFIRDSNELLNVYHDFTPYRVRISNLSSSCCLQHADQFLGCEDMKLVGDTIYTACNTDLRNRQKYWPEYSRQPRPWSGDKFYRWDTDTDSVVEIDLRGIPGDDGTAETRSFHGFDVNVLADGTVSIYAINHLRHESVIDKFHHSSNTTFATHVARLNTTVPGAPPHPNNVFSLPERDAENAIYVTNDHLYSAGPWRFFEEAAKPQWAWVSFHSERTGWKKALERVAGANGIAGDKYIDGRRVYVSEIFRGIIRVLEPVGDDGELKEVQQVKVGMLGDNVGRFGDDLYIAGAAKGMAVDHFMRDPETAGSPGTVIKRINTKQLGGGFFGGGYTADPIVELLVKDDGKFANMTTSSVFKSYQVEAPVKIEPKEEDDEEMVPEQPLGKTKGDLFITGLQFKGRILQPLESVKAWTYTALYRDHEVHKF